MDLKLDVTVVDVLVALALLDVGADAALKLGVLLGALGALGRPQKWPTVATTAKAPWPKSASR
jgi:hypothetical protein